MSIEQEIEQVELSIKHAKTLVERKNALHRLMDNPDYQLIFSEGFFKTYAAECVANKSDPAVSANPQLSARVENDIIAIGSTKQFLRFIEQQGIEAEKAITEGEEAHEELIAMQANGAE